MQSSSHACCRAGSGCTVIQSCQPHRSRGSTVIQSCLVACVLAQQQRQYLAHEQLLMERDALSSSRTLPAAAGR